VSASGAAAEGTAFPRLDAAGIAAFEAIGTRRQISPGEHLYRAGDATYDFFVVLSGAVDILAEREGQEQLVVRHGPGNFLGELNLLTGLRVFVSARVAEAGEVIAVPAADLRRVIATQPALSDLILTAYLARRLNLMTSAASSIRIIGSRFSPETAHLRELLFRTRVPHEWIDPDRDQQVDRLLRELEVAPSDLPVVVATGSVLRKPTPGELGQYLGLTVEGLPDLCFDLVVVGGGPAGLAAAVYGASEGLRTLGVEMLSVGGQAGASSRIENYLGFPTGISGAELTQRAVIQAEKFGAQLSVPCVATSLRVEAGHLVVRLSDGSDVAGRAVIAATGGHYRRLDAERLADFEGRGVYYGATETEAHECSSPVVVVGGGNSAGQAALMLADTGKSVTVVVRSSNLDAGMSRYLVERLTAHARIEVLASTTITALDGDEELRTVQLAGGSGKRAIPCGALFSLIGIEPASEWISGCAAVDGHGFVLTDQALTDDDLGPRWQTLWRRPLPFETSHPGLFAVGDLRSGSMKRVAAAVGEGSSAVRSVHQFLSFIG
jgi:thioredoxin reductase (NADPH)